MGEHGEPIVLLLFSPRCHPATVVTSKFSWTAEEDREQEKEVGRTRGRWRTCEEEDDEERRSM